MIPTNSAHITLSTNRHSASRGNTIPSAGTVTVAAREQAKGRYRPSIHNTHANGVEHYFIHLQICLQTLLAHPNGTRRSCNCSSTSPRSGPQPGGPLSIAFNKQELIARTISHEPLRMPCTSFDSLFLKDVFFLARRPIGSTASRTAKNVNTAQEKIATRIIPPDPRLSYTEEIFEGECAVFN